MAHKPFHTNKDVSGTLAEADSVDQFLDAVKAHPPASPVKKGERGRLIFALDATASRQATWDRAAGLTGDMFVKTRGLSSLDIQLVYYRGYRECRASRWVDDPLTMVSLMHKVSCLAGHTQIGRVLSHALAEARGRPVQALVFIGDCVEEPVDTLGNLAGQLKLLGLPVFIFQEGHNLTASQAFSQIARLSGGAHCQFDEHSVSQLGDLLNAVAVYASGGEQALAQLSGKGSSQAAYLLEQLNR